MALPPFFSTSTPTPVARCWAVATMPCSPVAGAIDAACTCNEAATAHAARMRLPNVMSFPSLCACAQRYRLWSARVIQEPVIDARFAVVVHGRSDIVAILVAEGARAGDAA